VSRYDAIVVGGGHNSLVAAAYLAKAGKRVLVLERLPRLGGAAVSHRAFEGRDARVSSYAYLVSLLPDRIVRDLGVRVELRERRVAAYAPEGLLVEADAASRRTAESFRRLTGGDDQHAAWLRFHAMLSAFARRVFPTLTDPVPARAEVERLVQDVPGAWEALAERPLGDTLASRFAHGLVRGVVSTDALIGTFARVDDPSLAQNRCFLWHVIGGPWRVPVGGMGAITDELARAAGDAELRTGAEVLNVDGGEVTWRQGDTEHGAQAAYVLAGVAPAVLERLRGRDARRPEGAQMKLNMLLDRLPRLRDGTASEDAFTGTFRLNEHEDDLARAYEEADAGVLPAKPPAELYCHSLTDRSILGETGHTLTLFGLHTPARLFAKDNDAARTTMVDRYLDSLDEHLAEPIRDRIVGLEAKTPLDIEAELAMPGGNIFHGELEFPWTARGGGWGVETDDPRILLCGAGALRGGGVSGIGGHNAAMAVLERSQRAAARMTARARPPRSPR
jgi:phytoene dehydrogenase-like protein